MLTTVVVPLDGMAFSEKAIPTAVAIARRSHASLRLIGVSQNLGEFAWLDDKVRHAAEGIASIPVAAIDVVIDADPISQLLRIAADQSNVLCFASHDRTKVATAVMHSVGSSLVARVWNPFVVVGANISPHADARPEGDIADVVVAVDGDADPRPLLATASAWAGRLQATLRIVTVYEPVPADVRRPSHFTRDHGPSVDPDEYLDALRRGAERHGRTGVATVSIGDPVSVNTGLADHLADRPAQLLVVGRRRYERAHRPSTTLRRLLRAVATPVLVVSTPDQRRAVDRAGG